MLQKKIKQRSRLGWVRVVSKVPREGFSAKVTHAKVREEHSRPKEHSFQDQ